MTSFSARTLPSSFTWSVAIIAAREAIGTLASSIKAAIDACSGVSTLIDVLVNGNQQLAGEASDYVRSLASAGSPLTIRVWSIATGDKANALNRYIHEIFPGAEIAFFVDGYAQVAPDAFKLMSAGLAAGPEALATSGVPSVGRSAKKIADCMIREGGAHGTLNALRGSVCFRLRDCGFRLPLGLYRVDGLLFTVITFNFDPAQNQWDLGRILVHPKATWSFRPMTFWRPSDLRSHWARLLRQSQGDLENLAIREHLAIQRKPPATLPATASELVGTWVAASPRRARATFLRNPLCLIAARRLRQPRDWCESSLRPELLAQVVS